MRVALIILLLLPVICGAEVMDKMPSLLSISIIMFVCTAASYFTARHKPIFLVILLPIFSLLTLPALFEVNDPYMAAAIANEAGSVYVFVAWLSLFIILIFACFGLYVRLRHTKVNAY